MASDTVTFYMLHPHPSKAAFATLSKAWEGLVVSHGYGGRGFPGYSRRQWHCFDHQSLAPGQLPGRYESRDSIAVQFWTVKWI